MYKLVIVDDEKLILDGVCEIFPWNNIGFEIAKSTTSAKEALAFIEAEPVDVLMTDIVMPDMSGLALAKELKKYPDLLILVLSSFSDYDYMREALQLNILDYILKPVNYADLTNHFQRVKDILDQRNRVNDDKEGSCHEKIIRSVNEYLCKNYQNARLGEAAEYVAISPSYLSKIYKEKCGMGFYDKLMQIRMEKAAEMMMNPAIKAYEIAALVGYDSPKNLTRAFKAYIHVTPREYRNGLRG